MMRRSPIALVVGVAVLAATARGELIIVDTLPGAFLDISGTGTPLHLGNDEEATITVPFGNAVFPAGDIMVANNGGVGYGPLPSPDLSPNNSPIPSQGAFGGGQCALPYWDDIGNTIGGVYHQEFADRYIVQWNNKPIGRGRGLVTFELQVFKDAGGPQPVYAQYIYADIEGPGAGGGASATIGYQNGPAAFNDVQWSFNTPGAVHNGTVLSVTTPEPGGLAWLAVVPLIVRRR